MTQQWKNIYLTKIAEPERGYPIGLYCPVCETTTFVHSDYAVKPSDGVDIHILYGFCLDCIQPIEFVQVERPKWPW